MLIGKLSMNDQFSIAVLVFWRLTSIINIPPKKHSLVRIPKYYVQDWSQSQYLETGNFQPWKTLVPGHKGICHTWLIINFCISKINHAGVTMPSMTASEGIFSDL